MPREPTGGKVGRPTKAEKPFYTPNQDQLIDALVENSKVKGVILAKRLRVSPSAISQARRNPVIIDEIIRRRTLAITDKIIGKMNKRQFQVAQDQVAFEKNFELSDLQKEALFLQHANKVFTGPYSLPGSDIWINTKAEYVSYLIKGKVWPTEVLEKIREKAAKTKS